VQAFSLILDLFLALFFSLHLLRPFSITLSALFSKPYLGGSLLLVGVILSFIGNLYQSKINREFNKSSAIEKMDTPIGFRGI
jgi:hypothetical protein